MIRKVCLLLTVTVAVIGEPAFSRMPGSDSDNDRAIGTRVIGDATYINANKILMFINNHGGFARDLDGVFGYDYGTFYPYLSDQHIEDRLLTMSPLYASGIWMGGKVNGQTRIAVSEYSSEYVPGPMDRIDQTIGDDTIWTYMEDYEHNSEYRVYKLYRDSLEDHPNQDYLEWPSGQGAPIDEYGEPVMLGEQLLWAVFNDACPEAHDYYIGETNPLGIEIQQTVWAADEDGETVLPTFRTLKVTHVGNTKVLVTVRIVDVEALSGDSYEVTIDSLPGIGLVWHLLNTTSGLPVFENQTDFVNTPVADGFQIEFDLGNTCGFTSFQVVANLDGPLDPPEAGAFPWAGFPTPTESDPGGYPTTGQQSGDGIWGLHTADNGGSDGGGTRGDYSAFLDRITRGGINSATIGGYDYEMRFTGSYNNPGVNGSYAVEAFNDDNVFWVPFELWNIGIGTPDNLTDDVRLVPFIFDVGDNDIYDLESWGSPTLGGGDLEHSVSGGINDPFTDWVYWYQPTDMSPGDAGYLANEADMLDGEYSYDLIGEEIMARTVLVNWNGGEQPPFNQDTPELGTVFRIITTKEAPRDTFTFVADPPPQITTGNEGVSIYISYKLHNRGGNTIEDCYLSLWSDPDVGIHTNDLVGCDTLDDIWFAYDAGLGDEQYGDEPPAVGFKLLYGPLVPSASDTGVFDGAFVYGCENLRLTSFAKYINGTDPNDYNEAYHYMQGLSANGDPYTYDGQVLHYMHSGDPVTSTGDVDSDPADRRMFASCGPFTFYPGDSQYVLLKMAVGQGHDALSSVTKLREILNQDYPYCCRRRGDINHDGDPIIDISDLVYMVRYMFQSGPPPFCMDEADIVIDEAVDIADIVYLVDYMFREGPEPLPCY